MNGRKERSASKPLLLVFLMSLLSCGTVQFYKETDKPVFYFNDRRSAAAVQPDSLVVLTFNIKEAEKIELAIAELKDFEKKGKTDVYLLQEMDEKGAAMIAKALELNYLYIPIVYNKIVKKNIGNAILTAGTIEHPEKLILPHSKGINGRRRHVTVGEVMVQQKKILVYSVHTETSSMSGRKRMDQVDAIIKHAATKLPGYQYFLIGGDFNTLFSKDAKRVIEKFKAAGFDCSTVAVGNTAKAFLGMVKPQLDYIFSKGLKTKSAGKIETSKASDHYPVFAVLKY